MLARAQAEELVDLVVISATDLCVLGGPKHPLFDENVARAWNWRGGRQRDKLIKAVTEFMLQRGLLMPGCASPFVQHQRYPIGKQPSRHAEVMPASPSVGHLAIRDTHIGEQAQCRHDRARV